MTRTPDPRITKAREGRPGSCYRTEVWCRNPTGFGPPPSPFPVWPGGAVMPFPKLRALTWETPEIRPAPYLQICCRSAAATLPLPTFRGSIPGTPMSPRLPPAPPRRRNCFRARAQAALADWQRLAPMASRAPACLRPMEVIGRCTDLTSSGQRRPQGPSGPRQAARLTPRVMSPDYTVW